MYIKDFSYITPSIEEEQSLKIDFNNLLPTLDFKPTTQWRRFSTSSKIASLLAGQLWPLNSHEQPSSIYIGSGLAMIEDTDKFLTQMDSFPPHQLSPTPFIQSTHNTVSGQLAMLYKSHGPNSTISQGIRSFDDAFWEAQLQQYDSMDVSSYLVGAVEEINELGKAIIKNQFPKLRNDRISEGGAFFKMSHNNHNSLFKVKKHIYEYGTNCPKEIQEYLALNNFEAVLTNSFLIAEQITSNQIETQELVLPFSYSNVAVLLAQMLKYLSDTEAEDLLMLYSFDLYWSFWHIEKCK